jgi:nicotinamide mononucleotide adenylyltransferase
MIKGVLLARLCPLHFGHEAVIRGLFEFCGGAENALVIIGSSEHRETMTYRVFFSYEERRRFLKTVFPEVRVAGLPDYPTNEEWFHALDDLLINVGDIEPFSVAYFGGCGEDVSYFADAGRKVHIYNRFDGTTPVISATQVRDALIEKRSIEPFVNPLIRKDVEETFHTKWEQFKRTK